MYGEKYFSKINSENREINLLQKNVEASLGPLVANPLLNGSLLTGVNLASGANSVNHKLGRVPRGWFIVSSSTADVVYGSVSSATDTTLTLTASGAITVSLWVF